MLSRGFVIPSDRWPGRTYRDFSGLCLVVVLCSVACDAPTEPDPQAGSPGMPWVMVLRDGQEQPMDSVCVNLQCDLIMDPGTSEKSCLCGIEGIITTAVQGGAGVPPTPPLFPEPPGNPTPDWWNWPIPPGTGGPIHPGDPEGCCDPYEIVGCPEFSANLSCPLEVPRGDYGECVFTIEPAEALEGINQWVFNSDHLNIGGYHGGMTWGGQIVESGKVTVHFMAYGRESYVTSPIGVVPRQDHPWTQSNWESQITLAEGQGHHSCARTWPRLELNLGDSALVGWVQSLSSAQAGTCNGQQIEPIGSEGYTRALVSGGPNNGAWYITNSSFNWKSASRVHDGALPAYSPKSSLRDSTQMQICRESLGFPPDSTQIWVNFFEFNNGCLRLPGFSSFIPAGAENHERQHFQQAEAVLQQADKNIYLELEKLVKATEFDLVSTVTIIRDQISQAGRAAAGPEPTGNWAGALWIWAGTGLDYFVSTFYRAY